MAIAISTDLLTKAQTSQKSIEIAIAIPLQFPPGEEWRQPFLQSPTEARTPQKSLEITIALPLQITLGEEWR
ncbi:hypothetical protein J3R74_004243 [Puniceicoccus vermicola]